VKSIDRTGLPLVLILLLLSSPLILIVYSLMGYSLLSSGTYTSDIAVTLEGGPAGTSEISLNKTIANATVVASEEPYDYYPNSYNILSGDWWSNSYSYRCKVTINNNVASPLTAGYSVVLALDTASLVSAGKMMSNGNDLRILYWNSSSSSWLELDRVVENMNMSSTKVWFKTQASIGASSSDSNYYVYYGYASAGSPPSNRNNVYVFWDDFDDGSISDWSVMLGTWSAATDQYVSAPYAIKETTGGASWIKPSATINEADVELEVYMRVAGGTEDWSIAARVQPGAARNWYEANPEGTDWAIGKYVADSWSSIARGTPEPIANVWYRVDFRIKGTQAQIWVDGSQRVPSSGWANIGTDFSSGTIALKTWNIGTGAWFDNVRLRRFVDPEPSVYLQDEELKYYVSGTVPASVQAVDSDYLVTRSAGTSTSRYFPSGYSLIGSTRPISGLLSNLQANDANYMTFRGYVSQTSTTSVSRAFIGYRSTTLSGVNYAKNRLWDGTVWGSENEVEMFAGSTIRWVRTAFSTKVERALERIVITLSSDGYFDAYVWDGPGTQWIVTNDIAYSGTTANAYRCFDIAYEKTTGRALFVYSRGSTTNEIGYKIWDGLSWSSEQLLDLSYTTGVVYWIALASAPGTRSGTADDNEIAMIYIDANVDVHGYAWTGSSWSLMGAVAVWDATAAIATEDCIAVAYEQISGKALFIWGDSVATDNYYRIWDGSALGAATLLDIPAQVAVTNWVTLKSDTASDGLVYLVIDGSSHLNTAYWSGAAWTVHAEHDSAVDTNARRCADFSWEPSGSKGLLVWGTTAGQITYKTFTAPNTWGSAANVPMQSGATARTHLWVQLRPNTRNVSGDIRILGAALEATDNDLGAIKWDGTTFTVIGASTFTTDTGTTTYECFDMRFQVFGDPTQLTMEAEFTGTSNTQSWTQLTWAIDSAWTQGSVTVTLQLYNYTLGDYPTSGNGYISYTSSTTPGTDETKSQTITTNPIQFRDGSGNWRIKVKGVKNTSSQFDFKADWIEFKPTRPVDYTVSTEFNFSNMIMITPTQLNFTVVSQYSVPNVNVTIQVWNYSKPGYVTSGEGYLTYISTGTNVTKVLTINTNPQFYTSNGNAKIKVTGVLPTTAQFQQEINQIKLTHKYDTYDYVLGVVSKKSYDQNIRLILYNDSNIGRLSNCTIWFRDSTTSTQIRIVGGAIVSSSGDWYPLPASSMRYVVVYADESSSGTSVLYIRLEAVKGSSIIYTCLIRLTVN